VKILAFLGRPLLFFSLLFVFLNLGIVESQDITQDLKSLNYTKASHSVMMLHNKKEHGSNMTCVALDEGLVFIDCGLFTDIAAQFRKDMENQFNKKTVALFLTHAHVDHFFAMGAFSDVKIIAAETSKPLFEAQLNIQFETRVEGYEKVFPKFGNALKSAKLFLPTKWFDKELLLGYDGNQLILRNTGGHTSGSSHAYYTPEKVIISGDLVQVDQYAYFGDPSTNMDAWITTLKKWKSMPVEKICPGHGRMVESNYLASVIAYFEEMVSTLRKLKEMGLPVKEVVRHTSLPKGYWPDGLDRPGWYDYAIARLYQEL